MYRIANSSVFPTAYFHRALKHDMMDFFNSTKETEFDLGGAKICRDIMNEVILYLLKSTDFVFRDTEIPARDNLLLQAMEMRKLRREIEMCSRQTLPTLGKPVEDNLKEYLRSLRPDVVYGTQDSDMSTTKKSALILILNLVAPEVKIDISSEDTGPVHLYIKTQIFKDGGLSILYKDCQTFTLVKLGNESTYTFDADPKKGIHVLGEGDNVSFETVCNQGYTAVLPHYFGKERVFETRSTEVKNVYKAALIQAIKDYNIDPDAVKIDLKELILHGGQDGF